MSEEKLQESVKLDESTLSREEAEKQQAEFNKNNFDKRITEVNPGEFKTVERLRD